MTGVSGTEELEAELLGVAQRAAQAAGEELRARFGAGAGLHVHTKSTPTDPVSDADLAAEQAIRHVLARQRPGDAILGEEGGDTPGEGALRWIVDPLDGTVNYLYGIPTFAVSVACEDSAGTLAGVVLNPAGGECFSATRSGPARWAPADGADPEPIERALGLDDLAHALVGTGFAYESRVRAVQGRVAARLLPRVRDIRRAGVASLDLASCALHRLDAFYERGVKLWDVAAGVLVCERAGLVVRPLAEVPGTGGDAELPWGVVVAPPGLIDALEALVAGEPPQ